MTGVKAARKAMRKVERKERRNVAMHRASARVAKASPCGHCGFVIRDLASFVGSEAEPGLWCVCVYCSGVNQLDEGLNLIAVSQKDVADTLPAAALDVVQSLQINVQMRMLRSVLGSPGIIGEA